MTPKDFLRCVAAVMPGTPSATRSAALGRLDARLAAEFPHARFTAALADAVASRLSGFPDWLALASAVRGAMEDGGDAAQAAPARSGEVGSWLTFLAAVNGDPIRQCSGIIHRLSIVRSYGGDAWPEAARIYRDVLAHHRPDWLPEGAEDRLAERRRIAATWQPPTVLDVAPPPIGPTVRTRPASADASPARSAGGAAPEMLLARYETLAAEGNRAAAVRAEMLRKRMEAQA